MKKSIRLVAGIAIILWLVCAASCSHETNDDDLFETLLVAAAVQAGQDSTPAKSAAPHNDISEEVYIPPAEAEMPRKEEKLITVVTFDEVGFIPHTKNSIYKYASCRDDEHDFTWILSCGDVSTTNSINGQSLLTRVKNIDNVETVETTVFIKELSRVEFDVKRGFSDAVDTKSNRENAEVVISLSCKANDIEIAYISVILDDTSSTINLPFKQTADMTMLTFSITSTIVNFDGIIDNVKFFALR